MRDDGFCNIRTVTIMGQVTMCVGRGSSRNLCQGSNRNPCLGSSHNPCQWSSHKWCQGSRLYIYICQEVKSPATSDCINIHSFNIKIGYDTFVVGANHKLIWGSAK